MVTRLLASANRSKCVLNSYFNINDNSAKSAESSFTFKLRIKTLRAS
ncbi:hypothetical protein SAMN04488134_107162 [Amphibacillus marinus]|uniref:Uncharacterized protein n=1 Tax=Amphibacillus marinus TaxID=872970 RepID=A0A1H8PRM1_9BACI|nr:hypothetical protein SAMN04488134_107162 [Amphibacillus marinus]